ncbi:MAG TPA: 50S ribosomal protein L22 [Firmicutes bacterium]|nr:50S ribosomal protein L22 [Bacillota bacterium]
MESRAVAKYIRLSPRKAGQVVDLIRGKKLAEALNILQYTPNLGAAVVEKVVRSAAANAEHNHGMDVSELYVAEAFVGQGPTLKRVMPRARGRADRIRKRMSHITVVLRDKKEG